MVARLRIRHRRTGVLTGGGTVSATISHPPEIVTTVQVREPGPRDPVRLHP